jgi:hypothetical protein
VLLSYCRLDGDQSEPAGEVGLGEGLGGEHPSVIVGDTLIGVFSAMGDGRSPPVIQAVTICRCRSGS